ncbi:RNA-directed DNA polymerase from mobile element jockey-like [Plakobranchus ocellatus]|uniref:RNA-directed DNA polymerase from mobile element jockey-like n=1 Tax=Plakobranchus ocellatus TaxID=259542 RepID=A0AAV3Y6U7_9GAST|nr:RNA-directed DNA polymerase from mobile element jockey-like [Plakobranchus ocellatus]
MKNSLEVIEKNVPKKDKKEHKKWINKEIHDLIEERRKSKNVEAKYKDLNRNIKIKCNAAKEEWINPQCHEIEQKLNIDSKFMHAKIKDVSGKKIKCNSSGCIKSKDGTILMEKKEIPNRWSEYVENLFKDDICKKPKMKKNIKGPTILKEKVEDAIKKMTNGKATGPDNIPVEIIKAFDNLGIDLTTKLLNAICGSGTILEDLCKSVFMVLPKTPGATECELHSTVSLMSHYTKILLHV